MMQADTPMPSLKWLRRSIITLLALLIFVICVRLLLDPIATYYTRKSLNSAKGIQGDFEKVSCKVFPPGYSISQLKILESKDGDGGKPFFYSKRAMVLLDWYQLFKWRVSAVIRIDRPKIIVNRTATAPPQDTEGMNYATFQDSLRRAFLVRAHRIEIRNGELLFRDLTVKGQPEIWIHNIELALENISAREKLSKGLPTTLGMHAILGRSGEISLSATANLFANKPEFAGTFRLQGYQVRELFELEKAATKMQTPVGTLDLFAKFKSENGILTGGVKPILKNVEIRPAEEGFGNKIKAWVADKSLDVFSDRIEDRNAVATTIPIKGKLENPNAQIWPAIFGMIRNAFVAGVSASFANLPPPTEEKSLLSQAKDALTKEKGPPNHSL